MTEAQKAANDAYRAQHPIPANETAEQKATREAQEKADKANTTPDPNPNPYTPKQY